MKCDCGCGVEEHFARLKTIELEFAIDESLRQTGVARRFLVRRQCYKPFLEELTAMKLLQDYVHRFCRSQKTHWWTRAWRMRKVVRLQFVILVRNHGIEVAKKSSLRSGLLFVASPRYADLLWRYWTWADRHTLVWRWNLFTPYGVSVWQHIRSLLGIESGS
jgi:hypothetical protein